MTSLRHSRHYVWPLLVLLVGLGASMVLSLHEKREGEKLNIQEFGSVCHDLEARIKHHLEVHEQILQSGAAFYAASDEVTRSEWRVFVERLNFQQVHPGVLGLGFAQVVPRAGLQQHIQAVCAEGFPGYRIWPEGEREYYTSIVYLEPFAGRNLRAFGYDMLTEPVRRAAMERARDQDETTLSGKVILVQESGPDLQSGVLMFVPVYREKAPRKTVAERRAALVGWVYSPYRMGDFMQGMLGRWASVERRRIRLEIFDGDIPASGGLLYDSHAAGAQHARPADSLIRQIPLDAAGHRWLLRFTQTQVPGGPLDFDKSVITLASGTIISLLLAGLIFSLISYRYRAVKLAARLTEDLRRSEERWQFALEGAGDGVWDWDVVNQRLFFSTKWKRMLGYDEADIGHGLEEWSGRVHPEDLPAAMADVQAHLAGRTDAYASEHRMRCKDGNYKWIHDRGLVVSRNAAGQPLRMVGTHTDITVRRQAEAALRASDEDYRQLFVSMLDGFALHEIICDSAGRPVDYRFLSLNPAFERLTGLRAAETVGRTVREIMPATEVGWIERYGRVALTGEGVEFEEFSEVLQRYFEIAAFRPKPGQFATVFIDVTERKRAEAALRESEERYQRITEAITDYIYTVEVADGRAVKTTHGPGCLAVTGYTAGEFAADSRLWLNMVVADDQAAVQRHADRILAGDAPTPIEHRLIHKNGSVRWVTSTIVPHRDADNVLVAYDGLIHDVTERKGAEIALSDSNYFLRKSQEIAWLGSYRLDIRAERWTSSPVLDELFGIDADYPRDLAGWSNLVAPEERAAMVAYFRDYVVAGRQRFDREYEIVRHSDGRWRWVHGTGELELDGAGQPVAMIGTIQDITVRRAAEAALRESERRLQEAQNLAHVGSWRLTYGPEGENWQATPELRRIYGRQGDQPLPLNEWFEIIHPEDRGFVEERWQRFLRGDGPGECEHRIVVHGQTKWLSVRARVQHDPATGRPVVVDGTSQDITERRTAEAAHARLATAVEQAAEAIEITDTEGVILYINPAFEKATGYTRTEAVGRNPRFLKSGKQDAEFYRRMWATLSRGEVWSGHFVNRRKDGTLFEEEATISPVRNSAGIIVNYVAVKRDVTHEVQLEAQFRQAQKMEAVGQLAGGVAHDFNNILAAVLMYLGLIQAEAKLDAATQASLKELSLEVQRGATLTRQLLAFSRQQAMEPKPLRLGGLVAGLFKMLSRLLGEDIIIKLQDESSEAVTEADPGMIEQVVINLCINARDAMPRGGQLTIRIEAIVIPPTTLPEPDGVRPGSFIRLSVTDTGEGMTPETLAHIFEPFYTTKAAGKGTGLGLATVYGIVQQHHGWIDVASAPGQGATFHVHLPASATPARTEGAGEPLAVPAMGRGESILLVEDETNLRTTVAMTLRLHGYQVLEAVDGPAALLLWRQERDRIDLVFTDMVMPGGMTGPDLIRILLAEQPRLKIIASTGYSPRDPKAHSTPDNRIPMLRKPYDRNQLLAVVRQRLDEP
ncbi:MAG: PAS domain S-box protein [Lacunisphaera sp.]|nr:PAS domain S-box protein [Lacunisphaera sp.]